MKDRSVTWIVIIVTWKYMYEKTKIKKIKKKESICMSKHIRLYTLVTFSFCVLILFCNIGRKPLSQIRLQWNECMLVVEVGVGGRYEAEYSLVICTCLWATNLSSGTLSQVNISTQGKNCLWNGVHCSAVWKRGKLVSLQ